MTETNNKENNMTTPGFTIAKTAAAPIVHVTVESCTADVAPAYLPSVGEALDYAFAVLSADPATLATIRETVEEHFASRPLELVDCERASEDGGYDLHFYFGGFVVASYNVNFGEVDGI